MGAGSRDGAMMRAVISHRYHCDLDSILVPGVTCGLSFLLVLVLAPGGGGGGGFPWSPVFLPPQKPTFPTSNSTWKQGTGRATSWIVH